MTSAWAPSQIDQLAAEHINHRRQRPNVKAERLVKCLHFAAEQGGDFWAVLGKALDQVIGDFKLPNQAVNFLRNLHSNNDKQLAQFLMPFMMQTVKEHQTQLDQLVAKGLIYDLLVKMSPEQDLLKPLISRLECREEKEEKELFESVSYSTHLKSREEVKQKLAEHEQRHAENINTFVDPFATPKWAKKSRAPLTPAIKPLEEYDSPQVPSKSLAVVSKEDSLNSSDASAFSPELKPLQSSSFNKTNDLSMKLFEDNETSQNGANYTGFNFSVEKDDDEEIEEENEKEEEETRTIEDKLKDISICSE